MSRKRTHAADRGLAAVARVREVRETDSRIGLQHVLADERAVVTRLSALEGSLAGVASPAVTTPAELLSSRTVLANLGIAIGETRDAVATAAIVSAQARARWTADKSRLSAVEQLLEKRAARRRTEAERKAAREADDLAAVAWGRNRSRGEHPA